MMNGHLIRSAAVTLIPLLALVIAYSAHATPPSENRGPHELRILLSPSTKQAIRSHAVQPKKGRISGQAIEMRVSFRLPRVPAKRAQLLFQPIDAEIRPRSGSKHALASYEDPERNSRFANASQINIELSNLQPNTLLEVPFDLIFTGTRAAGVEIELRLITDTVNPRSRRNGTLSKEEFAGKTSVLFGLNLDGSVSERTASGAVLLKHFQSLASNPNSQSEAFVVKEGPGFEPLPFDPTKFSNTESQSAVLPNGTEN